MSRGLVHVVASDAHDTRRRPPTMDQTARLLTREYGAETVLALMVENPRAILAGVPLPPDLFSCLPGRSGTNDSSRRGVSEAPATVPETRQSPRRESGGAR